MTRYTALDEAVEINGQTIRAMVDGVARFSEEYRETVQEAMENVSIVDPKPDEWYPQQDWLRAFSVLAEELEPHLLDRIGEQIPDTADWPTDISGVEAGLHSINDAYQRNHRGGDIGYYRFTRTGEETGEVTCKNPYPCPFDRGIVRAVTKRYAPVESFVFVEETGDECRRNGGAACTYTVNW